MSVFFFFVVLRMEPRAIVDMHPPTELCPWPPALSIKEEEMSSSLNKDTLARAKDLPPHPAQAFHEK